MLKFRKKRWIVVPAIVLAAGGFYAHSRMGQTEEPTVKTAKVERGTVTSSVSATGTIQPLTIVDVKSNAGGQVDQLAVDVGDTVKKGQLIAVIDPTDSQTAYNQAAADLQAANAKVAQAQQGLALQRAQTLTGVESATQALEAAKLRLLQAEEEAKVQPALTRSSIAQAEANYRSAKAALDQLRAAGAPQRTAKAEADFDQAQANFDTAEKSYKRQKELLAKGFIPKSQMESVEAQYQVAKANLSSAKKKLDTLKGELDEDIAAAEARVAQAKAALDSARAGQTQDKIKQQDLAAARAAVRQAQAALSAAKANAIQVEMKSGDIISARAQVERSKAQLNNAKVQLAYTRITAPRDGVVLKKYVEVGSIVNSGRASTAGTGAGTSLVQIGDTSRMFALVNVDETDIAQVEVGQAVDITVDAYPNELFEGKVTKIDPQATMDQNVTTIPVTVEFEDPDIRLKPGMNVTCEFICERKENVLMVPSEAIKEKDDGTFVQVMRDGKPVDRKVEVGIAGNEYTEVKSGLKEGEEIITAIIEPAQATPTPSGGSPFGGGRMRGMGRF